MDQNSINSGTEFEASQESVEGELVEVADPREYLTPQQLQYFKDIFTTFDTQNRNEIPAKSVGLVLRLIGLNPTKADIKSYIREIDPENKGWIDFRSFLLPIAQALRTEPETHEEIIAAFEALDEKDLGYLTTEDLSEYLTTLGEDLEDFEIEVFLKVAETKGTGKIYYRDFVKKMMGIIKKAPKTKKKKKKGKK